MTHPSNLCKCQAYKGGPCNLEMQIHDDFILNKHRENVQLDADEMIWAQMESLVFNVNGKDKT